MTGGGSALRPLERSLPIALLRAREAVMAEFRPILARHDVTDQQWRVLRALDDAGRPLSVGELAERACLLGPSVSRMLRTMEHQGRIHRGQDASDARRTVISLAGGGRALIEAIAPESDEAYRGLESSLGSADLDAVLTHLERIVNRLDRPQEVA
jgi:homoprotocatechuate degradation regulator HpaR